MIVPLEERHLDQVARLHCGRLTGLLSQLGRPAARAFYAGCVASRTALAFAEIEEGEVRGFVLGSLRPDRLRHAALRARPASVLAGVLAGVLRRPSRLAALARGHRGPDEDAFDPAAPELTYLAVGLPHRGLGIGERLASACTAALRDAGAASCEVSVDEDNAEALSLYEKLGFRPVGGYREFGIARQRLRLELRPR